MDPCRSPFCSSSARSRDCRRLIAASFSPYFIVGRGSVTLFLKRRRRRRRRRALLVSDDGGGVAAVGGAVVRQQGEEARKKGLERNKKVLLTSFRANLLTFPLPSIPTMAEFVLATPAISSTRLAPSSPIMFTNVSLSSLLIRASSPSRPRLASAWDSRRLKKRREKEPSFHDKSASNFTNGKKSSISSSSFSFHFFLSRTRNEFLSRPFVPLRWHFHLKSREHESLFDRGEWIINCSMPHSHTKTKEEGEMFFKIRIPDPPYVLPQLWIRLLLGSDPHRQH